MGSHFIVKTDNVAVAPLSRPDPFGGSEPSPGCSNVTQSLYQKHAKEFSFSNV